MNDSNSSFVVVVSSLITNAAHTAQTTKNQPYLDQDILNIETPINKDLSLVFSVPDPPLM